MTAGVAVVGVGRFVDAGAAAVGGGAADADSSAARAGAHAATTASATAARRRTDVPAAAAVVDVVGLVDARAAAVAGARAAVREAGGARRQGASTRAAHGAARRWRALAGPARMGPAAVAQFAGPPQVPQCLVLTVQMVNWPVLPLGGIERWASIRCPSAVSRQSVEPVGEDKWCSAPIPDRQERTSGFDCLRRAAATVGAPTGGDGESDPPNRCSVASAITPRIPRNRRIPRRVTKAGPSSRLPDRIFCSDT